MLKNNSEKTDKYRCYYCGTNFTKEMINQSLQKKRVLICEVCGAEIKIEDLNLSETKNNTKSIINSNQNSQKLNSAKNQLFNSKLRLFLFRIIYKMLKKLENITIFQEGQEELTKTQLSSFANALRKKIIYQDIKENWLKEFKSIRRIEFERFYENLQVELSKKRIFQEEYRLFFQRSIDFVFKLITGRISPSHLSAAQREVAEDLIQKYGFKADSKKKGTFGIILSVFLSRMIYDSLKDHNFEKILGRYNGELSEQQIDQLAHGLKKAILYQPIRPDWLLNFSKIRKLYFLKNYKRLQTYILTDHLYCVPLLDYFKELIRFIDNLMTGKKKFTKLEETKRVIANDLKHSDPFLILEKNYMIFKINLSLVLSRIVYILAKSQETEHDVDANQANQISYDSKKILDFLLDQIIIKNKINKEYLKKLYKINRNEFEKLYKKLKVELESDKIYCEQFSYYLEWIIKMVIKMLSSEGKKPKFSFYEKAIIKDLNKFSINIENLSLKLNQQCLEDDGKYMPTSNQSSSEFTPGADTSIISGEGTYQIERIQVPYNKEISHFCHLSKNLRNLANWLIRMRYFFLLKPENLDWLEEFKNKVIEENSNNITSPDVSYLDDFKKISEKQIQKLHNSSGRQNYHSINPTELMDKFGIDKNKLEPRFTGKSAENNLKKYYKIGLLMSYSELWRLIQYTPEYMALGGQTAQQTLKSLMDEWDSYFKSNEPNKRIPGYSRKGGEYLVMFTNQYIKKRRQIISKRSGKVLTEIGFTKKANLPNIQTTIHFEMIKQVRVVPRGNVYYFEVVYSKKIKKNQFLDPNRVVGIDIGEKNLLSIANNIGDHPRIVKGGIVKRANFIVERRVGELQSRRDNLINQIKEVKCYKDRALYQTQIDTLEYQVYNLDRQIAPAWTRRNNRVRDYFHKLSRELINYCVDKNIGTVVIGYNEGWKQSLKKQKRLGKRTRKRFVPIPFDMLCRMIEYKAKLGGVNVIRIEEHKYNTEGRRIGSSQTCCHCGQKGRRFKRGLFKCSHCGLIINADVNGAFNHAKWGKERSLFGFTLRMFQKPPIPLIRSRAPA